MTKDEDKGFEVISTHSVLFSMYHEGTIKGKTIVYVSRDNKEESITVDDIEIGVSSLKCTLISGSTRVNVAFLRIKHIYDGDEMIWDNSDVDFSNVKVIPRD